MEVKLLPYCEVDGIRSFTDSEVGYIYTMLEKEDKAEAAFCDGSVRSSEDFVHFMKYESKLWVAVVDAKVVGIAWLNNFNHNTAWGHFAFFESDHDTVEIGRETMRQLMFLEDNNGYIFSVLMGWTSSKNKIVAGFLKQVRMIKVGEIPNATYDYFDGQTYDAALFYITREVLQWLDY